ncbi:MAG: ribosome biogenesis GTPase YlqF [Phascolarctobacterium sp.]|nr:ribosome biogenesis GTPase YlqF [Candidatus Phascolarctobacterium caballi]
MNNELKIQWFPGHMTKARRMMEEQIKLVDVVVEMLDARIPQSSTNPLLLQVIGSKPRVLVLNKTDMADADATEAWFNKFKSKNLPVIKIDCATGKGTKQLLALIQQAAKPVIDKWLKKGVKNRSIRVMIVGIPNVGKSTLINRLVGKNKTAAQDRPGVTRGQQWVTIAKGLELLDTPGVLYPKIENPQTGFFLAVTGAVREEVYDRETATILLTEWLLNKHPDALQNCYNIEITATDTAETVLGKIAVARGYLKTGGMADMNKVYPLILKDFRSAKIGKFTLDEI